GDYTQSGGSYGGLGGRDPSTGGTNAPFGDYRQPIDFGVGGYVNSSSYQGSHGGGAIKLVVANRLEVYGKILSNGDYSYRVGGGSGGSIWIDAGELVGDENTLIEATGGQGYVAATGGGGRIAIYYDSISGVDSKQQIFARGGSNYSATTAYGAAGTVYLYDRSLASGNATLQVVNRSSAESYESTYLSGQVDADIYVSKGRLTIGDGAHIAATISGDGSGSAYVIAEGTFTAANNALLVDGFTLELAEDINFDSITVENNGK
uniref:hypothetical protein n=1 Tax=Microbulbifer hainanensis TaxID=2735675 RepID=UPI001D02CAFA